MTPHLIPIYISSVVAIGVLALFARHNRKTGWKKQSGAFAQSVSDFYRSAYVEEPVREEVSLQAPAIPSWAPLGAPEAASFSAQLVNLRASLGTAGTAPQPARELARK
ncbi:MAG: hypothetical protein JWO80_6566 [Bryobacterales bacterium]|nr:hypothetical protein [Bryobacterales bacterium]